jgi:hypothetical protein
MGVKGLSSLPRAIVAYGFLAALLNLVVVLPGDPTFSSTWGLIGSVLIQGLVIWRLAHGSFVAWLFGLLFALGGVASVALVGQPFGVTEILFALVCFGQAGVLLTRPSLRWPPPEKPAAAA